MQDEKLFYRKLGQEYRNKLNAMTQNARAKLMAENHKQCIKLAKSCGVQTVMIKKEKSHEKENSKN